MVLRISALISQFINNYRRAKEKGLLITIEIEKQKKFWMKREHICKTQIEGAYLIWESYNCESQKNVRRRSNNNNGKC